MAAVGRVYTQCPLPSLSTEESQGVGVSAGREISPLEELSGEEGYCEGEMGQWPREISSKVTISPFLFTFCHRWSPTCHLTATEIAVCLLTIGTRKGMETPGPPRNIGLLRGCLQTPNK